MWSSARKGSDDMKRAHAAAMSSFPPPAAVGPFAGVVAVVDVPCPRSTLTADLGTCPSGYSHAMLYSSHRRHGYRVAPVRGTEES